MVIGVESIGVVAGAANDGVIAEAAIETIVEVVPHQYVVAGTTDHVVHRPGHLDRGTADPRDFVDDAVD